MFAKLSLMNRFSGAAPLTLELVDALWNRLKIPVKQGYGMTELTVVTFLQVSHKLNTFIGPSNLNPHRNQKTGEAKSDLLATSYLTCRQNSSPNQEIPCPLEKPENSGSKGPISAPATSTIPLLQQT